MGLKSQTIYHNHISQPNFTKATHASLSNKTMTVTDQIPIRAEGTRPSRLTPHRTDPGGQNKGKVHTIGRVKSPRLLCRIECRTSHCVRYPPARQRH